MAQCSRAGQTHAGHSGTLNSSNYLCGTFVTEAQDVSCATCIRTQFHHTFVHEVGIETKCQLSHISLFTLAYSFQPQCSNLLRRYLILILSSHNVFFVCFFFLPWHLDYELCNRDLAAGNRRGTMGGEEANIH